MKFSGTRTLVSRSIYPQSGNCFFELDLSPSSSMGKLDFGFSGENQSLLFTLESGKVYDQSGSYLYTYNGYKDITLRLETNGSKYNIFANDIALKTNANRATGFLTSFFAKRYQTDRDEDFSVNIGGDTIPDYTIDKKGYIVLSGQQSVSGRFTNNRPEIPIRVFDSYSASFFTFGKILGNVYDYQTFAFTGDFDNENSLTPAETIFYSNFKKDIIVFEFVDLRVRERVVLFDNNSGFYFVDNSAQSSFYYNNYSGGQYSSFDTRLFVTLEYVSGSGIKFDPSFNTQGAAFPVVSNAVSGSNFIIESGYLTGTYRFATGDSIRTGEYLISGNIFKWATGNINGTKDILVSGFATGSGYTGLATGTMSLTVTGTIFDGSGVLPINQIVSGALASTAYSASYQSYTYATGLIDLSFAGNTDIIYINDSTIPIMRGYHYFTPTGLTGYLNTNFSIHKVTSIDSGNYVWLTAIEQGSTGNSVILSADSCNVGSITFSNPSLTGGLDIGIIGLPTIPNGYFSGTYYDFLTGSGAYTGTLTGSAIGVFEYTKTFTGSWELFTGKDSSSLNAIQEINPDLISGEGIFLPNSYIYVKINHTSGVYTDAAKLTISGDYVENPVVLYI